MYLIIGSSLEDSQVMSILFNRVNIERWPQTTHLKKTQRTTQTCQGQDQLKGYDGLAARNELF